MGYAGWLSLHAYRQSCGRHAHDCTLGVPAYARTDTPGCGRWVSCLPKKPGANHASVDDEEGGSGVDTGWPFAWRACTHLSDVEDIGSATRTGRWQRFMTGAATRRWTIVETLRLASRYGHSATRCDRSYARAMRDLTALIVPAGKLTPRIMQIGYRSVDKASAHEL